MDVREKLEVIAHLGDHITYKEDIGICYDSTLAKVIEDAYMTLKNGVTVQDKTETSDELLKQLRNAPLTVLYEEPTIEVVQEWISVKDRLPDYFEHVLINCPGDKPFVTVHEAHLRKDNLWDTGLYRYDMEDITHWCAMPQPPKGE